MAPNQLDMRGSRPANGFGRHLLTEGLTSGTVAAWVGVHVQTIRSWRGMRTGPSGGLLPRREPSPGLLDKLAASLLEHGHVPKAAQKNTTVWLLRLMRQSVSKPVATKEKRSD